MTGLASRFPASTCLSVAFALPPPLKCLVLPLGREAKVLAGSKISNVRPIHDERDAADVKLTASESNRLLAICVELIDLCSKVTARVDPTVGSVVACARDEAASGALTERADT